MIRTLFPPEEFIWKAPGGSQPGGVHALRTACPAWEGELRLAESS